MAKGDAKEKAAPVEFRGDPKPVFQLEKVTGPGSLEKAVRKALGDVSDQTGGFDPAVVDHKDIATATLAVTYAQALDTDPKALNLLGPKLLAVLTEMLLTPKARAAVMKEVPSEDTTNPLDEIKNRQAERNSVRVDPTPPVDTSAQGIDA